MNGLLVIVVGVLLIYLALSGKVDPLVQALKVAFGSSATTDSTGIKQTSLPTSTPSNPAAASKILDDVLSNRTYV